MNVLVVGGAGYIGSHMVKYLLGRGCRIVVLDDLSTGHRDAVLGGELVVGNLGDAALLDRLFVEHCFDAVMHFAAKIVVPESVHDPSKYYHNNVCATLQLLDAMVRHRIRYFLFSSTAAVYGEPQHVPIPEDYLTCPQNPYGRSKRMVERILEDYARADGLRYSALRYFNAAGADPKGELGPRHEPATHLISVTLQVASGRRRALTIFGDDYPTKDGTCIRDYIHV